MTTKWNWKKAYARLIGNWMTSFFAPLGGGGIALTIPFEDPNLRILFTALVSSIIITGIAGGRMFDEWSRQRC